MAQARDPFAVSLIVEKIFDHLPSHNDRSSFRLVNKLWRDISLDKWRLAAKIKIAVRESELNVQRNDFKLKDFCKLMEQSTFGDGQPFLNFNEKPIRQFVIIEDGIALPPFTQEFSDVMAAKDPLSRNRAYLVFHKHRYVDKFFNTCGTAMTSLTIVECPRFRQGRFLEGIKWLLLKVCPNLKKLVLDPDRGIDDMDISQPPMKDEDFVQATAENLVILDFRSAWVHAELTEDVVREIIKIVPNLKELLLSDWEGATILEALKYPVKDGKYIQLENLKFWAESEHLSLVRDYVKVAQPKIKKLMLQRLDGEACQYEPFHFHQLMGICSDNLTRLHITICAQALREGPYWISCLTGHFFPNVTFLAVKCEDEKYYDDYVEQTTPIRIDFRALGGFPKLETFQCQSTKFNDFGQESLSPAEMRCPGSLEWNDRGSEEDISKPFVLNNLTIFRYSLREKLSEDSLRTLASWTPSVKRCSFIADSHTLQVILDVWNLDYLECLFGSSVSCNEVMRERRRRGVDIRIPYYFS